MDVAGSHRQFKEALAVLEVTGYLMLIGPPGCGKSRIVEDCAKALGLPEERYHPVTLTEGVGEHHLLGRLLPSASGEWSYHPGPVTLAYEGGGLLMLDELDAAEPNAVLTLNSALSGGLLPLPLRGAPAKRHPEFRVAAAMNTAGLGATGGHSGRRGQDAALLDRFTGVKVMVDYDLGLERRLAEQWLTPDKAKQVCVWAERLREKVRANELQRTVSTRLVERASMLYASGLSWTRVVSLATCDWTEDETEGE